MHVIIGAMVEEVEEFLAHARVSRVVDRGAFHVHEAVLCDRPVAIIKCGVGKVFAAMIAQHVIDAYALSPPSAEITEAAGKGYVLIPLGKGEIAELTDYPYEVLMARPDYVEANPKIAIAVSRAISRGGALFRNKPEEAKAALKAHRLSVKLAPEVFELSHNMVVNAMPAWRGSRSLRGRQL